MKTYTQNMYIYIGPLVNNVTTWFFKVLSIVNHKIATSGNVMYRIVIYLGVKQCSVHRSVTVCCTVIVSRLKSRLVYSSSCSHTTLNFQSKALDCCQKALPHTDVQFHTNTRALEISVR